MSDSPPPANTSPSASVAELRRLCRTANHAVLATVAHGHKQVTDGWPVTSMVVPALDIDGSPILLLSDLADHTRHLAADPRASLLFAASKNATSDAIGTDSARITLFGQIKAIRDPENVARIRQRYLGTHPDAGQYADFADFGFYRLAVEALYWVGGFGKQRRVTGKHFIVNDCQALVTGHDDIVTHMNTDHPEAIADIVRHYSSRSGDAGWRMESIDCDGMILVSNAADPDRFRIEFPDTIHTPGEARDILVEMCKKSRG